MYFYTSLQTTLVCFTAAANFSDNTLIWGIFGHESQLKKTKQKITSFANNSWHFFPFNLSKGDRPSSPFLNANCTKSHLLVHTQSLSLDSAIAHWNLKKFYLFLFWFFAVSVTQLQKTSRTQPLKTKILNSEKNDPCCHLTVKNGTKNVFSKAKKGSLRPGCGQF